MSDDTNVVSFADHSNNSYSISVIDLLRETISDIESGIISPTSALILMYGNKDDGTKDTYRYCARLNRAEEIAMLEVFKQFCLLRWISGEGD